MFTGTCVLAANIGIAPQLSDRPLNVIFSPQNVFNQFCTPLQDCKRMTRMAASLFRRR